MLETPRLQLIPYSPHHLLTLIESEAAFAQSFGFPPAQGLRDFYVSGDVSQAWLDSLRTASEPDPWTHGFAVIDRETASVIGAVGFKGPPSEAGAAEIAYGIVPSFQNRGFATEAAESAIRFALSHNNVRELLAHTLPEENASTHVLKKCGFQFIGEVIDPDDGPVWRWQRF